MGKRGPGRRIPTTKLPPRPRPRRRTPEERLAAWVKPPSDYRYREWHSELFRMLGAGWTVRAAAERLDRTETACYGVLKRAEDAGYPGAVRSVRAWGADE